MKKALTATKNKTEQITLRYQIGKELNIKSVSYWDSLLTDTYLNKVPLYECKVLNELALIYKSQDRQRGIDYLKESIDIAENNGYKAELLVLIKNLLPFYRGGNNTQTVLHWSYKGLRIAEELKDKQAAVDFYSIIGRQYFFVGDLQKALQTHFNCLRIYRELYDTINIAGTLTDIGADYRMLGDTLKMCDYYLMAGKYAPYIRETKYAAYIYNSLASAYQRLKQADSCYKYSCLSYSLSQKINNKQGMASSLVGLGGALILKNELRQAEQAYLKAYKLAEEDHFTAQLPDVARSLKLLYIKENNYKKALWASDLYTALNDSISNEQERKKALEEEFKYKVEKKEQENKLLAQQNQIQQLRLNQNKYLFVGVGSLALIILIIIYFFLKQRRIRSEHENIQLEQKLLRSQMNPHFIFNSLNSIQQFIISQQNDQAEKYLSKFSRLVRELLESNIKESISVKEETDILRGYLEMESLRFRRSFSFSISIHEHINQEYEQIPHMMIQPFVENAIWHGLLPKDDDRALQVTLEPGDQNTIRCIIEDNGIGRKEAMKKETTFKRKSLALSFVRQRVELMRKHLKVNCSIEIIDKVNDHGASTGTKVILILPVLNR